MGAGHEGQGADNATDVLAPPYNLAVIRQLLSAAFTDKDLRRFCQDRPPLRPIVSDVSSAAGLQDHVDAVVGYCDRHALFSFLLAEVKQANPGQFALYEPRLRGEVDWPTRPPSHFWQGRRRLWYGLTTTGLVVVVAAALWLVPRLLSEEGSNGVPMSELPVSGAPSEGESEEDAPVALADDLEVHGWPLAAAVTGMARCAPEVSRAVQQRIQAAFEPAAEGLVLQVEPEISFTSPDEARAWAGEQALQLVFWGQCDDDEGLHLWAEMPGFRHALGMAELTEMDISTGSGETLVAGELASALVAYGRGDYALAASRWPAVERLLSANPDPDPRMAARLHFVLGNSLVYAREFDAAVPHYEQALDLQPSWVEAANNLGVALFNRQLRIAVDAEQEAELSEALQAYEQAIEIDPDYLLAYLNRAQLYLETYDYEYTMSDCEQAIALSGGQSAAAFACRASVWLRRDPESPEFLLALEKAEELGQGQLAPVHLYWGFYYQYVSPDPRATDAYRTYLELLQQMPLLERDRYGAEEAYRFLNP